MSARPDQLHHAVFQDASSRSAGRPRLIDTAVSLGPVARDGAPQVRFLKGALAGGLVYDHGVEVFAGHPESGKSTICQRIAVEYMEHGGHVVHFDWEEGEQDAAARLLATGASAALLESQHHYLPFPALAMGRWDEVEELWDAWPGSLGLWDSMGKALGAMGLKENDADDVTGFLTKLSRLSKSLGISNLMIDHVSKSNDGTGTYAGRGSGAKLAASDVTWYVDKVSDFSQTEIGEVRLLRKKARRGNLPDAVSLSIGDGHGNLCITKHDQPSPKPTAGGESAYARIRRDVRAYLAEHPDRSFTKTAIECAITGNAQRIRQALDELAQDPEEPVFVDHGRYHYSERPSTQTPTSRRTDGIPDHSTLNGGTSKPDPRTGNLLGRGFEATQGNTRANTPDADVETTDSKTVSIPLTH